MSQPSRQKAILELLERGPVASQEDLQRALGKRGFKVGQATLSRDIHDLHLVKTGTGYARPQDDAGSEPPLPPVSRLVREVVVGVCPVENLLVSRSEEHTSERSSQDRMGCSGVLGRYQ